MIICNTRPPRLTLSFTRTLRTGAASTRPGVVAARQRSAMLVTARARARTTRADRDDARGTRRGIAIAESTASRTPSAKLAGCTQRVLSTARSTCGYCCFSIWGRGMLLTKMLLLSAVRRTQLGHTTAAPAASCRDRWLEPFSSQSIWNTAIGAGAVFKHARLFQPGDHRGNPANFHNDQDFIVRTSVADPVTEWINQGVWGAVKGGNCAIQNLSRSGQPCSAVGGVADGEVTLGCPGRGCVDGCVAHIRLPDRWTSASDCDGPAKPDARGKSHNNS